MSTKSYLEIKVSIRNSAVRLDELKELCDDIPVKWQNGYYHIAMAFLKEATKEQRETARQILDRRLKDVMPMPMTFNKVDAFSVSSCEMHVINLTSSLPNAKFMKLTDDIRNDLLEAGLHLDSAFRLHVTLGRVVAGAVSLKHLRDRLATLAEPSFTLNLYEYEYRVFRGKTIGAWISGQQKANKLAEVSEMCKTPMYNADEITEISKEKSEQFFQHLLRHFGSVCVEHHRNLQ